MPISTDDFDPTIESVQVGTHQYVLLLCPMLTASTVQSGVFTQGSLELSMPGVRATALRVGSIGVPMIVATVLMTSFLSTGRHDLVREFPGQGMQSIIQSQLLQTPSMSVATPAVPLHSAAPQSHDTPPSSVAMFLPALSSSSDQASSASRRTTTPAERREHRMKNIAPGMSVSSASASSATSASVRSDNKVGVYLTAASVARKDFLDKTIEDLIAVGGNALVFDVKGGRVLYHSAAPMANDLELVVNMYELPELLSMVHEKGLYSIARFVAIKDDGLTEKLPSTRIKTPKGTVLSQTWVDPANDTAIEYNMQVVCELASMGIHEINFDYIRFSTEQPVASMAYKGNEKADRIEKFIRTARETINRCGPKTKLGLSTFAILGWDFDRNLETLGQDVRRFAPYVDIISPMAYPATFAAGHYYVPGKHPRSRMYYLVNRTITGYQELLGPEQSHKLRPWIQGYGVTTKDMREQIDAVYDAGLCGYQVWNANNAYKPVYSALKDEHTRPAHCEETVAMN